MLHVDSQWTFIDRERTSSRFYIQSGVRDAVLEDHVSLWLSIRSVVNLGYWNLLEQELHMWFARRHKMLHYALVFLVIAIVAAFLGFGGIAGAFVGIAKILFFLFLIAFVVSLVMNVARRA